MFTLSAKLNFYIAESGSLKDKRQVRRSLIEKARYKFNAAIAEIDTVDSHKLLTIGIAVVSGDRKHRENSLDEIIRFMEKTTAAELTAVEIID